MQNGNGHIHKWVYTPEGSCGCQRKLTCKVCNAVTKASSIMGNVQPGDEVLLNDIGVAVLVGGEYSILPPIS